MNEKIEELSLEVGEHIKTVLADEWDALTNNQKNSAIRASKRYLELKVQKAAGKDVEEDLLFVERTIEGFKLSGKIKLYNAWWEGVNKALEVLGSFLAGLAKGLI